MPRHRRWLPRTHLKLVDPGVLAEIITDASVESILGWIDPGGVVEITADDSVGPILGWIDPGE